MEIRGPLINKKRARKWLVSAICQHVTRNFPVFLVVRPP